MFDLFRIAHIGVIAQGYAPEWETKVFNSFSAQGSESSHISESSHPCAKKIQVRTNLKIDRTPVHDYGTPLLVIFSYLICGPSSFFSYILGKESDGSGMDTAIEKRKTTDRDTVLANILISYFLSIIW